METHVIGQGPSLEVASVELLVLEGPDRGRKLVVNEAGARIGTAPGNQLRLTDPTVSRMHCEVRLQSDGVRLLDGGSTNGTYLDGVRVGDAFLSAGSMIRLGATAVRAEFGDQPFHLPLSARDRFGDVLGTSVAMRRIYSILERVAPTDATVLIQGETGTGKECVARAVHRESRRAGAPFVAIDCGAIADNLIESELFGHVRGAFSGATANREGLFEEADGGTVFLDEIGELPLALQPKLLRVLEGHEIRRVGTNTMRPVNVRVLAATNRPLAQAVNLGTFREDLYYRLAVVEIVLPPLRARREDIPLLAQHFFHRFAADDRPLGADLLSVLLTRSWPGNIRELRNFIEQRVSLGLSPDMRSAAPSSRRVWLPPAVEALVPSDMPFNEARAAWIDAFERTYVRNLLARAGGNVTRAAEIAGVNRRFIYRLMDRLGIGGDSGPRDE